MRGVTKSGVLPPNCVVTSNSFTTIRVELQHQKEMTRRSSVFEVTHFYDNLFYVLINKGYTHQEFKLDSVVALNERFLIVAHLLIRPTWV